MAFRCEEIQENDKHILDMQKLYSVSSAFVEPTRWAVDRERSIYLFNIGGGGLDQPEFFAAIFNGETIRFEAERTSSGNYTVGITALYTVANIIVPSALQNRIEEIRSIIRDGLDAYGIYGNRTHIKSLSVEFKN